MALLVTGYLKGHPLCARQKVSHLVNTCSVVCIHDRFHPPVMNRNADYFGLISYFATRG